MLSGTEADRGRPFEVSPDDAAWGIGDTGDEILLEKDGNGFVVLVTFCCEKVATWFMPPVGTLLKLGNGFVAERCCWN